MKFKKPAKGSTEQDTLCALRLVSHDDQVNTAGCYVIYTYTKILEG